MPLVYNLLVLTNFTPLSGISRLALALVWTNAFSTILTEFLANSCRNRQSKWPIISKIKLSSDFLISCPKTLTQKSARAQKYLTPSSARVLRTIERPKDDFEEVSCLWLYICPKNVFYVERAMLSAGKRRSRSNFWSNKWRDPTKIYQ